MPVCMVCLRIMGLWILTSVLEHFVFYILPVVVLFILGCS
jgi:hypothetical protein